MFLISINYNINTFVSIFFSNQSVCFASTIFAIGNYAAIKSVYNIFKLYLDFNNY